MLPSPFAVRFAPALARAVQLAKSAGLRPQKSRDLALHTPHTPHARGRRAQSRFFFGEKSRAQSAPFAVRFAPGLLGLPSYLGRPASDLKSREISPLTRPPTPHARGRRVQSRFFFGEKSRAPSAPFTVRFAPGLLGLLG